MQPHALITSVKTLGDRIKEEREGRGWSQQELAARAGVSQGTIGNLEAGLRKSARNLLGIAAALEVRPEWLATGKGEKVPFGRGLTEGLREEFVKGLPGGGLASEPTTVYGDVLTDREREFLAAFRDLPQVEQDELYTHVMDRARTYREHAEKLLRERFGVTGFAPNDKVTEAILKGTGLPPAPQSPTPSYKLPPAITPPPSEIPRAKKKKAGGAL
jgi:transcriptional regulator with XRE-family HTH domain